MSASPTTTALASVRTQSDRTCDVALILGSGLGTLSQQVENSTRIAYHDIDGFPVSTAPGHEGELVLGDLYGREVAVLQGRFHLYEGWTAADIATPIRVLRGLGAKSLVVTNAAGGLNPSFRPGDIMLIDDHINFTGANPLIGPNDDALGLRFPDMSRAYTPELKAAAQKLMQDRNIDYRLGVYAGVTGPSLETSAERRFLHRTGADAVGMSTVIEVIAAVHAGLEVIGFSAITNMATGEADQQPDSIEEVYENAAVAAQKLDAALAPLLAELP